MDQTLDLLDRYLDPEDKGVLTGTLSSFSLIPEAAREDASRALKDAGIRAFPDDFVQGMLLYPECPMYWLFSEWANSHRVDPEVGIPYLKGAVIRLFPGHSHHANLCRVVAFRRIFVHGRIAIPNSPVFSEILPRYPSKVTEEETNHVESVFRAMFAAFLSSPDFVTSDWPKYFWRHNFVISACRMQEAGEEVGNSMVETTDLAIGSIRRALNELAGEWRRAAGVASLDLYAPEKDEVLFGLLSRQFRLFKAMVSSPTMWSLGIGRMMLRVMADTQILLTWLIQQADPDKYRRFREYSLGKLKLYKLHLTELASELGLDTDQIEEELSDQINEEIWEELLPIDVGNVFEGTTIRAMADACGLGNLYRLVFNPGSADVHGDWVSLTAYDLNRCLNPLHRFHRLPQFQSDLILLPSVLSSAAGILIDSMKMWLNAYSLETRYSSAVSVFSSAIDQAMNTMSSTESVGETD